MISIEFKSKRSNLYELQVRAMISQMKDCWDVDAAINAFNSGIKELPRLSVAAPIDYYTIRKIDEEKSVEVWHNKINGDLDRLVAVLKNI